MKVVAFQQMMSDSLLPPMAHPRHRAPSPSPSPSPPPTSTSTSRQPVDFSPPLIAMVVVVAAAFIVVTYCRLISRRLINPMLHLFRHRRRYLPSTITDSPPPPDPSVSTDYYGLDDAAIKTLPLSIYRPNNSRRECAVCLVEFGGQEYVRTLPVCSHAFHVDCIDVWLKSQANCPLCRAAIFVPLMAARISPSLDAPPFLIRPDPTPEITTEEASSNFDCHHHHQDFSRAGFHFSLKRSYSFGFERRLVTEAQTASPWRKRMSSSPFLGSLKPRVMSFRYSYRGMKAASPLLIRRRILCRRSKWMAGSPMSSRMRCGDPEALVSPERLNRGRRGEVR